MVSHLQKVYEIIFPLQLFHIQLNNNSSDQYNFNGCKCLNYCQIKLLQYLGMPMTIDIHNIPLFNIVFYIKVFQKGTLVFVYNYVGGAYLNFLKTTNNWTLFYVL